MRILRNIAIGLAAAILLLTIGALVVVRTYWFHNYVKQQVISAAEDGTGGKVEIGSFSLDWSHLRAIVTDLVIHGNEPTGSAPFVRVGRLEVDLRLFTSLQHIYDITYLGIDKPEANIIVFPDGHTNAPTPKPKPPSNKSSLETVVDLAVGRFDVTNGLLTFNSKKQALNVRGNYLRAQLQYDRLRDGYQGKVSLNPIYVASGRNTPVNFTVTLPVALYRNRVDLRGAKIATASSQVLINAAMDDLRNPQVSAHINGQLSLSDLKNAGDLPLALNGRNLPSTVDLSLDATLSIDSIRVAGLRLGVGHSFFEAAGMLKDPGGRGSLLFKSQLSLNELGRLANLAARPEGVVNLNGQAELDSNNEYQIASHLRADNISFLAGTEKVRNVNLSSAIHLDPRRLDLRDIRLRAFGGELAGEASLAEYARYQLKANLLHLDLLRAAHEMGDKTLAAAGVVSGPIEAQGDLKAPSTKGVAAQVRLAIVPARQGVPVSGRLWADYNGATDNINISNSYIALPHTRLTLDGSLGNRLSIGLTTRDLDDLFAVASMKSKPPVALNGGQATVTGVLKGTLSSLGIWARLAVNRFRVAGRQFDALALAVSGSSSGVAVSDGSLTRGAMQARFSVAAGLRNWSATPNQPISAEGSIRNGDLADIAAMSGQPSSGYSGTITANAQVSGTVGNPRGSADLLVADGTIHNVSFDRIQARLNMTDRSMTVPVVSIVAGQAHVELNAEFEHPADTFQTGQIHAHVQSSQLNLAQLRTVNQEALNLAGQIQLQADVRASLAAAKGGAKGQTEFLLTSVNADVRGRGLRLQGRNYDDFIATAETTGQTVNYNLTSDFAGSDIRVNGNTRLVAKYPTSANGSIRNLAVERVLTVTNHTDFPAKGQVSVAAHFTGTTEKPEGNLDLDLTNAVLYDEPVDRVRAQVTYLAKSIDVPQFDIVSGPSQIGLKARYEHPDGNFHIGDLQFRLTSSRIDLQRIRNLQKARPGLAGALQIAASGAATVREAEPRILFRDLNANLAATDISARGKNFGGLTLSANAAAGRLNFNLDSNLAGASIHGRGNATLTGDYPADAQLAFNGVALTRFRDLLAPGGEPPGFDAVTDGQVTVSGPVLKTEELRGSLQLSRLRWNTIPEPGARANPIVIQNQEPISVTLDRDMIRVASLHLTGPQTDIQLGGGLSLRSQTLDLDLNANANLALLQQLNRNIVSAGSIVLATTARGPLEKPAVNGRLELHNASFNSTQLPNGISNANGLVLFNGNSASIQNLTAESGGGKVTLGGFVAYDQMLRFGVRANAANLRLRFQQGESAVADANINLNGTMQASTAAGTVMIKRITYAPQSDLGSMLTRAAPPVQSSSTPSPLLDNMKLDIQVRTSPSLAVQSSTAENVQANADLRVRGTPSQPSVLGRVSISEGQLVFFGSTYMVNTGTIYFYNPIRIEPVLDFSLETQAKGVDVVLKVTGPIDNLKLTYTSDPPLQFQEIVALLAAGTTPTSDPNILANQPSQPQQSFQQRGETALVSGALANPVANQLQRVFGVSQLKIDPTFSGGSVLPQARLTLQQRISNNITFTYITALNDPNTQIIRAEWAVNQQWSATATRDQNGIFSITLFYKKQFR
jgi:translocation and assembly module TamB